MYGYTHNKDACAKRLRRVKGQIRGQQRMVEERQIRCAVGEIREASDVIARLVRS